MSAQADGRSNDEVLAAEYALGTLPHVERQAFEARLAHEPRLREMVERWAVNLSPLADGFEPVAPPPEIYQSISARLFGAEAEKASWWASLSLWRTFAGLSFATALALGAVIVTGALQPVQSPQAPVYVTVVAGETGAVRMVALFDPQSSTLKVKRTDGTPGAGRDHELWMIAGSSKPVSLGVLPGPDTTTIPVSPEMATALTQAVLAITEEPEGGSPSGDPTGPVLATGQISAI